MADDEIENYAPADLDINAIWDELGLPKLPIGVETVIEFEGYLRETDHSLWLRLREQETVRIIPDEYDGLRTTIIVAERTTSMDIRDSIALALQLRDRLTEWQGYYLPEYAAELLNMIDHGMSYAEIAEHTNKIIEGYLGTALSARKIPIFEKALIDIAGKTLFAMRFKPSTIDGLLNEWLGYLERGEKFFSCDMPIDRDKVISVIKYWRTKPRPSVA